MTGPPETPFDSAQGKPFGSAQGRPFDAAQSTPFDSAQGKPALRRALGKWDLTAIGVNQVIGSAIFLLPSQVAVPTAGCCARRMPPTATATTTVDRSSTRESIALMLSQPEKVIKPRFLT